MDERERRIQALMPLVRRIAQRLHGILRRADYGDLIGDGCVGLVRAVDDFDPARGASLRTYASRVILSSMLNGVRRMDPVPERARRALRDADEGSARYVRAKDVCRRALPLSLDAPLPPGDGVPLDTSRDPAALVADDDERAYLRALVDGLPQRQRRLVLAHYYGRASLRRISEVLEISPQRASQLHLSALARLRKATHDPPH